MSVTDKKGKKVESAKTSPSPPAIAVPYYNSDTDFDVLSVSSRCVSSDDSDLKGSWCGVGHMDGPDDDTDDPDEITFTRYEAPPSPQALKMPTLAFSIDSLSESTPTPSKYFFKDDPKLEWDVVVPKQNRSPPRYRDNHILPALGAPVDRVCLLSLCGTQSPAVHRLFTHFYGFRTEVELVKEPLSLEKMELRPATSYVAFICLSPEESVSSALLKIEAALYAKSLGFYITCWAPTLLNAQSAINSSVFEALQPLQEASVLSFPLPLDSFDPLDIQLIEWEEHAARRKRTAPLLLLRFDLQTIWKTIVVFLLFAISAQIVQYFQVYSIDGAGIGVISSTQVVTPKIAAKVLSPEHYTLVHGRSHASEIPTLRPNNKNQPPRTLEAPSVIIVPPYQQETSTANIVEKQEQPRLLPPPPPPTAEKEPSSSFKLKEYLKPLGEAVGETIRRAQRHKIVQSSEYKNTGVERVSNAVCEFIVEDLY